MTDQEKQEQIFSQLNDGTITQEDLKSLVAILWKKYKANRKSLLFYIEWYAYNEMFKRLTLSQFSEIGNSDENENKKNCISEEFHNTKLFIETINKTIETELQKGDITDPKFYGQPDTGFKFSIDTLVHIILRHNPAVKSFISTDANALGDDPSSLTSALFSPILAMLMALDAVEDDDWKESDGKNLICNFQSGDQKYTLVRRGTSNKIISFYPNNNQDISYIELEREPDKMRFIKKQTSI